MLSKCANPECSRPFRFLHEGKLFRLTPSREVQIAVGKSRTALRERFWLCDECSRRMTIVWSGDHIALKQLPARTPTTVSQLPIPAGESRTLTPLERAAFAGRRDG